jgi:hypothetical protein
MVTRYDKNGHRYKKPLYALDLSDEHMTHIYRFLCLGKFDREQWRRMRAYCAWMRSRFAPAASAATNQKEQTPPEH